MPQPRQQPMMRFRIGKANGAPDRMKMGAGKSMS
jgi:hypothetical protein